MTLQLTRKPADGTSVRGVLSPLGYETLENLDYLIPAGTYRIAVTWSPRFKRPLPLVCDVPNRSGIRFHRGSVPEHSRGCILLRTTAEVNHLTDLIRNEPTKLTIV